MAEGCSVDAGVARKSETAILQHLAKVRQTEVATAIGKSDAWVSRWKDQDCAIFTRLLAAIGLKTVPAHFKCYDPKHIEHLEYFAKIGLAQETSPILEWGEPD